MIIKLHWHFGMRRMSAFYERIIDPIAGCYLIAEAGVNHNGNTETAKQLIDIACVACADAVKFQTFKPEALVTEKAPLADYQRDNLQAQVRQQEMLTDVQLKYESHEMLQSYCNKKSI